MSDSMESDNVRREKIIAFLQGVIVDLQIGLTANQGELSLLGEKCRSGDYLDIDEALKDVQSASYHKGYHDGVMKMVSDIIDLID